MEDLTEHLTKSSSKRAQGMHGAQGVLVPPISVRDNLELESNEYRFLLRGKAIGRGVVQPGRFMAMNVSGSKVKLRGLPTREPVFNLEAVWIEDGERKSAELNGYTVVDPASVMITHLSESLKGVTHLLLGRQEVQTLVDHLKEKNPANLMAKCTLWNTLSKPTLPS